MIHLLRARPVLIAKLAVVFGLYLATAHFGLNIYAVNNFAALIWPPAGIAIAATYVWGAPIAIAVAFGAFAANAINGAPLISALFIAIGNALEALAAAYVMRALIKPGWEFRTLQGNIDYIVFVAIGSTFISASIGVSALWLLGVFPASEYLPTFTSWWIGDALSALIIAPLLIAWSSYRPRFRWKPAYIAERTWFTSALLCITLLVFWAPFEELNEYPFLYLIIFPLMWAILRLGPRSTTFAIALTATIATYATLVGLGPFSQNELTAGLLFLQLFVGAISIVFLIFLGIVEDYKTTAITLADYVERLEKALSKIQASERAKNDFLAILSHELRNPLAPVMSTLELLRLKGASVPNFSSLIDTTYANVERIARLLEDLLDITRISQQRFSLRKEVVDLKAVLDHAISLSLPAAKNHGHKVKAMFTKESVWLDADPIRLEQIFINLLNNAAKYTDPGGTIEVRCVEEPTQVSVAVSDTGIGIPKDKQEKIFEPFEQLDRERGTVGLGIGLSLTKHLVDMHGGTIRVESEGAGSGSTFTVRLPRADISNLKLPSPVIPLGPAQPKRFANATHNGFNILVVDDNVTGADGIASLLAHIGHDTRVAYSGRDALATIHSFTPDVVLVDIGLPDTDGYALAKEMRERIHSPLLLVAVTGYGQPEDKEKALRAGFDHHLTKPVAIVDIENVLKRLHQAKA